VDVPDEVVQPIDAQQTSRRREPIDLDWRTILAVPTAVLGLFAVFAFVRATRQSLTWIVIGTVLAVALDPVVDKVQRRLLVRRGVAVGMVGAAVISIGVAIVIFLGPPAVREAQSFSSDLPGVVERLGELPIVGERLREADAPARLQEFIEELPERLSNDDEPLVRIVESALGGALATFSVLLVTIVLLLDGHRILQGLRRVVPHARRDEVDSVLDILTRTIGHYFAGSLFVAVLSGMAMLVVGLVLGVPLAPLAAIWATMTNLIPQIGGFLGGSFFVLLGLADSPRTGVLCLVYFLVWQQIENHVITPTIVGEAVDLSPPTTMMAALVGGAAAGVPGALIAVPLIGSAKAIYCELRGIPRKARERRFKFLTRLRPGGRRVTREATSAKE
jgi:predicted PurR-regulated permease PerM